jgi:hypothetical protein
MIVVTKGLGRQHLVRTMLHASGTSGDAALINSQVTPNCPATFEGVSCSSVNTFARIVKRKPASSLRMWF